MAMRTASAAMSPSLKTPRSFANLLGVFSVLKGTLWLFCTLGSEASSSSVKGTGTHLHVNTLSCRGALHHLDIYTPSSATADCQILAVTRTLASGKPRPLDRTGVNSQAVATGLPLRHADALAHGSALAH